MKIKEVELKNEKGIYKYFINKILVLETKYPEHWDLVDFKEYCIDHEKAIGIFIDEHANDYDRLIPKNVYDFKYFIETIEYALNPNREYIHIPAFINRHRPIVKGTLLYSTTNDFRQVDYNYMDQYNISVSELAMGEYVYIGSESPFAPSLQEYKLHDNRKIHWLHLTHEQYDYYISLPDESMIYYDNDNYIICKEDIDFISVYNTKEEDELNEIPFDC